MSGPDRIKKQELSPNFTSLIQLPTRTLPVCMASHVTWKLRHRPTPAYAGFHAPAAVLIQQGDRLRVRRVYHLVCLVTHTEAMATDSLSLIAYASSVRRITGGQGSSPDHRRKTENAVGLNTLRVRMKWVF
jgi:hypothetical protein